jgi:signal transduction histidine kinase
MSKAGAELSSAMLVLRPVTKAALGVWLEQAANLQAESSRQPATPGHRAESSQQPVNGNSRILKALVEVNLRLQECERDRAGFLARLMHDFRAPLTATNGYCGLLLAEELGPLTDIQKEVLGRTQNSLRRLSRMTTAIFHLAVLCATRCPH